MKIELIDYTGAGAPDPARAAAEVLVFTKQTRLKMTGDLRAEIASWPEERIASELEYMANTIPSSWEFISYTFLITGVTRAFTHQFVRTRTGSYAQQTMRVLDVEGWDYATGPSIAADDALEDVYEYCMNNIDTAYRVLIDNGAKIEDARGVLPTNILTNIVAKFDLRTLADTARKRASRRTQGEYRAVMEGMLDEVLAVHPWAELFLARSFDTAARELEDALWTFGSGSGASHEEIVQVVKLLDQMRASA